MAVVKMGQIKSTPAKALAYISRPDATADGLWVSTNADTVIDPSDFRAVARQFSDTAERVGVTEHREGLVLAHHVIQSFDPNDGIDAATAHRIGVQLAESITNGEHEYMIATHLDKGHVHNHIIVNAVNRVSGRRLRVQRGTIGEIRNVSDALCRAEGLRVIEQPERASGRSMADIYRQLKGESGKQIIRTEIDKAASRAHDWTEFEAILARVGIETSVRGGRNGTLAFREISMGRPIRDHRLGLAYTESSIMARLTRQVVNEVSVDVSMVTRETRDTMTVVVPGTKRTLHLTVAKSQVIRRGRALRLYVPANDQHALSDREGRLARTVGTDDLYQWFSKPDMHGMKTKEMPNQWQGRLTDLRELRDRVNAKVRWGYATGAPADAALARAAEFVADQQMKYQATLVAVAELTSTPSPDARQLDVLRAELRITEREIDAARIDVQALTQLTKEETRMSVASRIGDGAQERRTKEAADQQRAREHAQQRNSRAMHANDAETPAQLEDRADEAAADALMEDDAAQDRDGGTRSMSLQERIQLEADRLKAREEDQRAGGHRDRDGRSR